jgi:hypothetical protein
MGCRCRQLEAAADRVGQLAASVWPPPLTRTKPLRKRMVKVGEGAAPSQDYVTCGVGVVGPWVRIVSGVVGEETVMGSLLGRLRPPRAARRRAPTVRPGHPRPARRRTRACGRLCPDHTGQAHMERSG